MICVANWKMNMGYEEARKFLFVFKNLCKEQDKEKIVFLPPACLSGLFEKEEFYWGSQNIYPSERGSFTGENSLEVYKNMGASFCLVGHSERRNIFGETDVDVSKKFYFAHQMGLIPILCVGEMACDRSNKEIVFKKQLGWIKTYGDYQKSPWKPEMKPKPFQEIPFIIAYEPIWAIGTGETPSSDEINASHQFIKEYLGLPNVPVFYGGSVSKENASSFAQKKDIDGFLIGSSSLKAEDFYSVYNNSQT